MTKSNQSLVAVLVVALLIVGGFWYMSMNQKTLNPSPTPISESAVIVVPSTSPTTATGSPATSAAMKKEENLVSMSKNTFAPSTLSVKVGETVTWVNNDTWDHNVTSDDNTFVSPTMKAGAKYSYTFTKEGMYDYACTLHVGMKGKIVVTK